MIELIKSPPAKLIQGYTWKQGDQLLAIGEFPLRDILDFYYLAEEEGQTLLSIADENNSIGSFPIATDNLSLLAESFAAMEFKTCAAQCVFCFIDQNPQGMRENIYLKDEDYRFSFLYGNYITLTSLGKRGLRRVIEQKLSPLFVSVHATDIDVRTELLGIKRRIDVMAIMKELTNAGIEIHAQIVMCPDHNDGDILKKTLDDLGTLYDGIASVSVVPVGLSDHREGLTELRAVTKKDAENAIDLIEKWGDVFLENEGQRLSYASDEFYLKAQRDFPPLSFYEGMPQEDTGIGGCRSILEESRERLDELRNSAFDTIKCTILTGTLAASYFQREILPLFEGITGLELRVVGIENTLYGKGITVAGLLPGIDFLNALEELPSDTGIVFLPETPINHDDLFLDDMSWTDLMEKSPFPLQRASAGIIDCLLEAGRIAKL